MHRTVGPMTRTESTLDATDNEETTAIAVDQAAPLRLYGALVAIAVFATTVSVNQTGAYPFYSGRGAALAALAALGVVPFLRGVLRRERPFLAAVAVLVSAGVSTALSSNPAMSFWGQYNVLQGYRWMVCWILAWAAVCSLQQDDRRRVRLALEVGLGLNILLAFAQGWFELPGVLNIVLSRAHGLTGNPVFGGTYGAVALVLFGDRLAGARSKVGRVLALAAIAGAVAMVQLSGTRIALAACAGVAVWVLWKTRGWLLRVLVVAACGAGVVVGSFAPSLSGTDAVSRVADTSTGLSDRAAIWEGAWDGIRERPLLGHGPDRFISSMPDMGPEYVMRDPDHTLDAHNHFIEILYATGVVGVLAWVSFLYVSVDWRWRGAAFVSSVAVAAVGMVEPFSPAVTPVLFTLLGLASALPDREARGASVSAVLQRVTTVVGVVAATGLVAMGIGVFAADTLYRQGVEFQDRGRFETAFALTHDDPQMLRDFAVLAGSAAFAGNDEAQDDVLTIARQSAATEPADWQNWVWLGNWEAQFGSKEAAGAAFRRAEEAAPWHPEVLRTLFTYELRDGDRTEADRVCAKLARFDLCAPGT